VTAIGGRPPAPLIAFDEWSQLGRWWPTPKRAPGAASAVVVHHTVTGTSNYPHRDAQQVERVIYGRRWSARFSSVPYNFLLHPDGTMFEGRGVTHRNAANNSTRPGVTLSNSNTLSVALIGDYRAGIDVVTPQQRTAFSWLTRQLAAGGHVTNADNVVSHSALAYTECPALALAGLQTTNAATIAAHERHEMVTLVSTTTGAVWVAAGGRARRITNSDNWLRTFDGPVIRADYMEHVVADLYDTAD
jgi:hypothetical protein